MRHFRRSSPDKDELLFAAIAKAIDDIKADQLVVMTALLPMVAHATLNCGFSKDEFLETAGLTWDGIERRFGVQREPNDFNESEERWVAAFREAQ